MLTVAVLLLLSSAMQRYSTHSRSDARFHVRVVSTSDVSKADTEAWENLEDRAAEPNAYLSPHFLLPAARHLTPGHGPKLFIAERRAGGSREIVGVWPLRRSAPTRRLPLPHFVGYASKHSFLSGALLDRDHVEGSLSALLGFLARNGGSACQGVDLPLIWENGCLAQATRHLVNGRAMPADRVQSRAVLYPDRVASYFADRNLAKRVRDLDRRLRRLREQGQVEWRWSGRNGDDVHRNVESFLQLEHAGWKGQAGSSLRSRANQEAFFTEMMLGFASAGRALFTELVLDGRVVASTANLVSGRAGFAFKVGWDPALRSFSPGLLNELEFMRRADSPINEFDWFDSGAAPDSYIDELWLSRRRLARVLLPLRMGARLTVTGSIALRRVKKELDAGIHGSVPLARSDLHTWITMAQETAGWI